MYAPEDAVQLGPSPVRSLRLKSSEKRTPEGGGVPPSVPASGTPASVPASGTPASVPASGTPASVPASGTPASVPASGRPPSTPPSGGGGGGGGGPGAGALADTSTALPPLSALGVFPKTQGTFTVEVGRVSAAAG